MASPRPALRTARSTKVLSIFHKPIPSPTYPSSIPLSALARSQPPTPARSELPSVYVFPPPEEDQSFVTCAFDSTQPPSPRTPDLALLEAALATLARTRPTSDAPVFRRPSMRDMENGGIVLPRRRETEPIAEPGSRRSMSKPLERSSTEPVVPLGLGLRMPAPSPPPSIPLPPLPTEPEMPKVLPKRASLFFGTRPKLLVDLDLVESPVHDVQSDSPPPLQHPRPKSVIVLPTVLSEARPPPRIGSPPPSSLPIRRRPSSDDYNLGLPNSVDEGRSPPVPVASPPPRPPTTVPSSQQTSPIPSITPARIPRPPLVRHTATTPPPSLDATTLPMTGPPPLRKRVQSTPSNLGRRRRSIVFQTDGVVGEPKHDAQIKKRSISPPMKITPRVPSPRPTGAVHGTEEDRVLQEGEETKSPVPKKTVRRPKSLYGLPLVGRAGTPPLPTISSSPRAELPMTIEAPDVPPPEREAGYRKSEPKLRRPKSLYGLPSIPGLSRYFSESIHTPPVPPLPSGMPSPNADTSLSEIQAPSPSVGTKKPSPLRRPKSFYGLTGKDRRSVVTLPETGLSEVPEIPEVPEVPEILAAPPSSTVAKQGEWKQDARLEEGRKVRRPKSLYGLTAGFVSTVKLKGGEDEEVPTAQSSPVMDSLPPKRVLRRPKSVVGLPSVAISNEPFPVAEAPPEDDLRVSVRETNKEKRASVRSRIRSLSIGLSRRSVYTSSPPPPVPPLPLSLSNSTIRSPALSTAPHTPASPLTPSTPFTPATPTSPHSALPSSPAQDSTTSPSPSLTTDDTDSPVESLDSHTSPLSSPRLGLSFGRRKRFPLPSRSLPATPTFKPEAVTMSPIKLESMRFSALGFDVSSFELGP